MYELRNNPDFAVPIVKSVHKGLESLSYSGLKIRAKIKKWNPENCPWRLCKIYLENVGFI